MRGGAPGVVVAALVAGGFLAFALTGAREPVAPRTRLVIVVTDSAHETLTAGLDRLLAQEPGLARRLDVRLRAPSTARAEDPLPGADVLLVEMLDPAWVEAHAGALGDRARAGGAAIGFGPRAPRLTGERLAALGLATVPAIDAYWEEGGPENVARLLRFALARHAGVKDLRVLPPLPRPRQGYVAWDAAGRPLLLATFAEWEREADAGGADAAARPRVAILESAARARQESLEVPRAIVAALATEGLTPIVVFGQPGSRALAELLVDDAGRARADAIVSLHLKFPDADAEEVLARLDIPAINAIRVYGRTLDEWRASTQGLTAAETAWQLAIPEIHGLAPPNVVAAPLARGDGVRTEPIGERVRRVAARARALVTLRRTPPGARRIAILFWNYPPGKQNVGASYLNVVRSLPEILRDLRARGYDTGPAERLADEAALERAVLERGRNVARAAPDELDRLVAAGEAVLLPVSRYRAWFGALPAAFRDAVVAHWGAPETADIMTREVAGETCFVIPALALGNVRLLAQPDRARTQDLDALYHKQDLPPHHQYVATYLWLRQAAADGGFDAHAIVHLGTHGTLEWLSGKESGLSGSDAPEALLGALPVVYPYIVDDVGEGIVAKRRGAAVVVDHLTPALGPGGLSPELEALRARVAEWKAAATLSPDRARALAAEIEREAVARGLDVDLAEHGWSPRGGRGTEPPEDEDRRAAGPDPAERLHALEEHLDELRERPAPFGLHTFGVSPSGERLEAFAALVAAPEGGTEAAHAAARRDLAASGPRERDELARGLAGGYVRPAPGNDPVRSRAAIPTGNDFFAFDPRTVPTEDAAALGARLAEELVRRHRDGHGGAPPRRIALAVWGVETIRHAGVQEAQALALLGVRLARDGRGRVIDLELVPREALGRPRVDVVLHATSLYRDTFPGLMELLDRAVRLAASSPEEDNPIAAHAAALARDLVAAGIPPDEARRRALVRIFAEPTGLHDSKVSAIAHASGSWDREAEVARAYLARMGHGYGGGLWGVPMEAEFRAALRGTEAIVHSRSSRLYGTLDNDDFFGYAGSIALGVRYVEGGGDGEGRVRKSPPFLVADLATPGRERLEPIQRVVGAELRSRLLNPAFIAALRDEGYAGARETWKAVEHLWGWQVVYPETVGAAKWQEIHEVWLEDRHGLGLERFFAEHAPHARQAIAGRLLETVRKGYWDAPAATRAELVKTYVEEVATHGVSCDHLTCDDPDLQAFVGELAPGIGDLDAAAVSRWREAVERATGRPIASAAVARAAAKGRWHEPGRRPAPAGRPAPAPGALARVSGLVMETVPGAPGAPSVASPAGPLGSRLLLVSLLLLPLLAGAGRGALDASRRAA